MGLADSLGREDHAGKLGLMARMVKQDLRVSKVFPVLWDHRGIRVFLVKPDRREILEQLEIPVQGEIQVNISKLTNHFDQYDSTQMLLFDFRI